MSEELKEKLIKRVSREMLHGAIDKLPEGLCVNHGLVVTGAFVFDAIQWHINMNKANRRDMGYTEEEIKKELEEYRELFMVALDNMFKGVK